MARVITILNQKGGVGKTTTVVNLGAYLAYLGKTTLVVDLDPQFNATIGLGVRHAERETIYHALIGEIDVKSAIRATSLAHLDIVPSSPDLSGALVELLEFPDRNERLRNVIAPLREEYDFILIDLGPSLNVLTLNGLLASDEVLIPVQCEYFSLEGIHQLLKTVELVKKNLGHPIKISGALLTMYDKREKLSREMAREIRKRFPYRVYDIEIPQSVALAESPSHRRPVMLHAPQSSGALAYEALAREIVGGAPEESRDAYNFEKPEPTTHEEAFSDSERDTYSSVQVLEEDIARIEKSEVIREELGEPEPFLLIDFSSEENKS